MTPYGPPTVETLKLSSFTFADMATFHAVGIGALVLVGLASLFAFALRRRLGLRAVMALHMLNLLVVLLSLFILLQPKGLLYGSISMFLLIALFRAMSKFENTDKQ